MWGLSLQPTIRPQSIKDVAERLEKVTVIQKPLFTEDSSGKKTAAETEVRTGDFQWTTDKVTTEQEPDEQKDVVDRRKLLGAVIAAAAVVILVIVVLASL